MTRALIGLVVALALALTACGKDNSDRDTQELSATEHNSADVDFASNMIPHHAQALSMADMTMGRDLDPKVADLVEDIRMAQGPEIETMTRWLTDWDEKIPSTMRDHVNSGHGDTTVEDQMEGMDHSSDMPGMMSAEDMAALEKAPDVEFQKMWLQMMIEHHQGAVEMAETEQDDGKFKPAVELAGEIISAQEKEIRTMEQLLA